MQPSILCNLLIKYFKICSSWKRLSENCNFLSLSNSLYKAVSALILCLFAQNWSLISKFFKLFAFIEIGYILYCSEKYSHRSFSLRYYFCLFDNFIIKFFVRHNSKLSSCPLRCSIDWRNCISLVNVVFFFKNFFFVFWHIANSAWNS